MPAGDSCGPADDPASFRAEDFVRPDESGVAQPAYATPECDSIVELVAAQRAGDEILTRLAAQAEESLTSEGSPATLAVSRVEAAQSESYLVASAVSPERYSRLLEPFLATRWIYGAVVALPTPLAALAAAAFADEGRYRRLKITGAGSGTSIATASQIETAVELPPQTTRARLRGLFIRTAKDHRQNFTVDWVHLKLNDQRTLRCSDPLNANVEMALRLIASILGPPA